VFNSYPQKLIPQNTRFFYPSSAKINSALINSLKYLQPYYFTNFRKIARTFRTK